MLLASVLEDAGFTVFEAARADRALTVLEDHPEVCAVVTDVHMPGSMNGLELAATTRARRPAIAVLVTSAGFRGAAGELPEGVGFIPKPWRTDALVALVLAMVNRAE